MKGDVVMPNWQLGAFKDFKQSDMMHPYRIVNTLIRSFSPFSL